MKRLLITFIAIFFGLSVSLYSTASTEITTIPLIAKSEEKPIFRPAALNFRLVLVNGKFQYQTRYPVAWSENNSVQLNQIQQQVQQNSMAHINNNTEVNDGVVRQLSLAKLVPNSIADLGYSSEPNSSPITSLVTGTELQISDESTSLRLGLLSGHLSESFIINGPLTTNNNTSNNAWDGTSWVEKVYLEGALNIWSLHAFTLSLEGKIEASQTNNTRAIIVGYSTNIANLPVVNSNNTGQSQINYYPQTVITRSLSLVGSYILSDSWALTGAMINTDVNEELKRLIKNKQSRDNIALFGTTYSF